MSGRSNDRISKVRDSVGLGLGTVMLLYMTYTGNVNPLLVGAALLCLAGPTGLRVHQLQRRARDLAGTITGDSDGRDSSSPLE